MRNVVLKLVRLSILAPMFLLSLVPAGAAKFRVNVAWHALMSAHIVRAEFKLVILTDSHPSRRFKHKSCACNVVTRNATSVGVVFA